MPHRKSDQTRHLEPGERGHQVPRGRQGVPGCVHLGAAQDHRRHRFARQPDRAVLTTRTTRSTLRAATKVAAFLFVSLRLHSNTASTVPSASIFISTRSFGCTHFVSTTLPVKTNSPARKLFP